GAAVVLEKRQLARDHDEDVLNQVLAVGVVQAVAPQPAEQPRAVEVGQALPVSGVRVVTQALQQAGRCGLHLNSAASRSRSPRQKKAPSFGSYSTESSGSMNGCRHQTSPSRANRCFGLRSAQGSASAGRPTIGSQTRQAERRGGNHSTVNFKLPGVQ